MKKSLGAASDRARLAASILCVGFEGTSLSDEVKRHLDRGIRAFILFARNVESPAQIAELTCAIKDYAPEPTLICVDQEGGSVRRLRQGFSAIPPMATVAKQGGPSLAAEVGSLLGRELRAVGIDLDLAPVLDVNTNPENPVIGERAFSGDPELVSACGLALARALEQAGVASCAKHFPGHGDTQQDSHISLPRVGHPRSRLDAVELQPFRAYARAGLAAVMTAHVVFDALDPACPATISRKILTQLLRDELGFRGLIVTDDLNMRAVAGNWAPGPLAARSLAAGADLLLVCRGTDKVDQALDGLSAPGPELNEERLVDAAANCRVFFSRWARPANPHPQLERLGEGLSGVDTRESLADPTRDGRC